MLSPLLCLLSLLLTFGFRFSQARNDEPPNFIFIVSDDVGFGDLACYGHPYAETPNLDRLAAEGTMYTQFDMTGNVCTHTRSGLMTGRNPSWFPNFTAEYGFLGALTITKLLQEQAGYVTGHIGKWNIGPDPEIEYIEYGIDDLRLTGHLENDPRGREGLRFDDAIDFVEQNQKKPFYLNLWIHATHTPIQAPEEMIDRYRDLQVNRSDFSYWMQSQFDEVESLGGDIDKSMQLYLADLYEMDLNVGRLLDTLDALNLTDNTIVVFTSDNGPASPSASLDNVGYAGILREGKHFYYEGGVRMPFIVRWPGRTPAGEINPSLMFGIDWLPTVCTLAGCDNIPWSLVEGEDMSDVFLGAVRDRQTPLLWRGIGPSQSYFSTRWIRYGPWKMVGHDKELYNLDDDPEERNNIYNEEPDIVQALIDTLHAWNATLPIDHARNFSDPLPFDPLKPVDRLPLPNIDLGNTGPKPTIPPSPAPTAPTSLPTPNPTAPTATPSTSPTQPRVGPDCQIFEELPFTALAYQYCAYNESTLENNGGFGSGPVDVSEFDYTRDNFTDAEAFCGGKTFIRDTVSGEYVEYVFNALSEVNLTITAKVSSVRPRNLTMRLTNDDSGYFATQQFNSYTAGWFNFTALTWKTPGVPAGMNRLRVTFTDGFTNLCAIDFIQYTSSSTPTSAEGPST